jgi:hypothetical protein
VIAPRDGSEKESVTETLAPGAFNRGDLLKAPSRIPLFTSGMRDAVRGKDRIDLASDPPPEWVIEVALSRSSLPRFPILDSRR